MEKSVLDAKLDNYQGRVRDVADALKEFGEWLLEDYPFKPTWKCCDKEPPEERGWYLIREELVELRYFTAYYYVGNPVAEPGNYWAINGNKTILETGCEYTEIPK